MTRKIVYRFVSIVFFSEAKKLPIKELNLSKLLGELEISMEQFIDLCILCGCDYTDSIKGSHKYCLRRNEFFWC